MTCTLKAIVAVCDDWGIGRDGDMVVSNRADMRHFVACTKGHPVIMGRKTLESFPGGKPLKDRRNIVLTSDASFSREGIETVHSIDEALAAVCVTHAVDTFFPNLDEDPDWLAVDRQGECVVGEGQGDAGLRYEFVTYRRSGRERDDARPGLLKFLDTASDIAIVASELL